MRKIIILFILFCPIYIYGQKHITNGMSGLNTRNTLNSNYDTLYVSKTLRVSNAKGYTSIQSAVTAASEKDVIKIYPGDYNEQVDISKSLTLVGNGQVVLYSVAVLGGDTVNLRNLKMIQSSTPDTLLHINTSGYVSLENIELVNTGNANLMMVVDDGVIYGRNVNIKDNNGVDKVMFYGGESHLQGDYIYTLSPDAINGAKVFLNYERLGCVFEIEDSAMMQIDAGMIRSYKTSDYSDTLGTIVFTVRDTAKLILSSDNLNAGVVSYSSSEVSISNSYGDAGRIYFAQFGSGKFYVSNNNFIYRNNNLASHIVESVAGITGSYISSNNTYQWRADKDGFSGSGNPIFWLSGNFSSYNDTWLDYGNDSTDAGYVYIGVFRGDFTADIQGSRFIYKGGYSQQSGFYIDANDSTDLNVILSDVSFDVPNYGIAHGGSDWTEADDLYLYDVKMINDNSTILERTNGTSLAIQSGAAGQTLLNISALGESITYSPIGKYSNSIGKYTYLSWRSDTVRMAYNGQPLDSVVVTLTIDNSAITNTASADFKLYMHREDNNYYSSIYDISFDQIGNGLNGRYTFDVTEIMGFDNGTDWVAPTTSQIKFVGTNTYYQFKFAIVNSSLTYDTLIQLQAFNCIGIQDITVTAQ